MISKQFLANHPIAGDPTHFKEKILSGQKIHTIRHNYDRWKQKAEQINAGTHVLELKEWSGKPYRSKQNHIAYLTKIHVQRLDFFPERSQTIVDGRPFRHRFQTLANNDGLSVADLVNWFPYKKPTDLRNLAIIHFTDFKY